MRGQGPEEDGSKWMPKVGDRTGQRMLKERDGKLEEEYQKQDLGRQQREAVEGIKA